MKRIFLLSILLLFSSTSWALVQRQNVPTGELSIEINWIINFSGNDALSSLISFKPNKQAPTCERLSFIQTARLQVTEDIDYIWDEIEGQKSRNFMMTSSSLITKPGYFIDHDALKCQQGKTCSPFYRDSWENPDESHDGESSLQNKKMASMFDAPYGWERFEQIDLEACAVCQNGSDLQVLACAHWGGKWLPTEDKSILPVHMSEEASATFYDALKKFHHYYK